MLVAILLFVFPLLFVWVTQSFFVSASDNINTAQKQRIGMIHDTLTAVLQSDLSNQEIVLDVTRSLAVNNPDIQKITVYDETENGFLVYSAIDTGLVDTYDPMAIGISDIGFSKTLDFQQFPVSIDGKRIWRTYKQVLVEGRFLYIFTEYDLSQIDATMTYRRQQSYFGLSAIFLFLIVLAYWLNKQVNWQKHHSLLAKQLEERDMFSSMIAHEFRAPLTVIKGYASFLQQSSNLPPEEKGFAGSIRSSSERLVFLVNDFLEVARLQSGKLKIERVDVDLRDVLSKVVADSRGLAEAKGLKLSYVAGDLPVLLKTDQARLIQILTNIINNAIKYTEKGSVNLELTDTRAGVNIRIKNTGMGISAADQQKLFTQFTRVGGVDQTNVTGSGLGMWITKQLVALLRGTIGIESITGVGTHVVINFRD
jgi:signal transduction histidine kinase